MTEVVVANGQFFGGGLKVAPRALPDDGTFNVQTWRGEPWTCSWTSRRSASGSTSARPVREWQSADVDVDAAQPLTVEADGEVLGTTPARFDVLPAVLPLKI